MCKRVAELFFKRCIVKPKMYQSGFDVYITLARMLMPCPRLALLVFLIQAVTAFAQTETFSSPEAAIAALFPNDKFIEWTSTNGDWNGDGNEDRALIVTQAELHNDQPREIRLVVLAGVLGGTYSLMSLSGSYCSAQHSYGFGSEGTSLLVTALHKADGPITDTLHFRFNKKLGDFELIGRENVWGSPGDKSYGRLSINELAGLETVYETVRVRIKQKRSHFKIAQLARLNGFECEKYIYGVVP